MNLGQLFLDSLLRRFVEKRLTEELAGEIALLTDLANEQHYEVVAERFPNSKFTAVSNSTSQREYIDAQAQALSLENVQVITADINSLELSAEHFDRVVSVEMFEHVRNYAQLLSRISRWLAPDGKLFAHIFCHHRFVYPYESEGASNWMGRYFFSGGLLRMRAMPYLQEKLVSVLLDSRDAKLNYRVVEARL